MSNSSRGTGVTPSDLHSKSLSIICSINLPLSPSSRTRAPGTKYPPCYQPGYLRLSSHKQIPQQEVTHVSVITLLRAATAVDDSDLLHSCYSPFGNHSQSGPVPLPKEGLLVTRRTPRWTVPRTTRSSSTTSVSQSSRYEKPRTRS